MGIKISIKNKSGHWTVNDKKLSECNLTEKDFFNRYIQAVKLQTINCKVKRTYKP